MSSPPRTAQRNLTLAPETPISAATDILGRRGRAEGYLVDADGTYRGMLTLVALEARSAKVSGRPTASRRTPRRRIAHWWEQQQEPGWIARPRQIQGGRTRSDDVPVGGRARG